MVLTFAPNGVTISIAPNGVILIKNEVLKMKREIITDCRGMDIFEITGILRSARNICEQLREDGFKTNLKFNELAEDQLTAMINYLHEHYTDNNKKVF